MDANNTLRVARLALALAAAVVVGTGCATLVRGPNETLDIATSPPGATVTLSTGQQCISPCSFEVRRRGDVTVAVEKENCVGQERTVRSRMDTFGLTSLIGAPFTAFVPFVVVAESGHFDGDKDTDEYDNTYNLIWALLVAADLATGAVYSHTPNPLYVSLDCVAKEDTREVPDPGG